MRLKRNIPIWTACLLVLLVTSVSAQVDDLEVGARVQIKRDSAYTSKLLLVIPIPEKTTVTTVGEIRSLTSDSIQLLVLSPDSSIQTFALNDIKKISVSIGQKRATVEGLLIGTYAGASLGFIALAGMPSGTHENDVWTAEEALRTAATITISGALAGMVFGYFLKTDKWKEIDRNRWRLTIDHSRASDAFRLSLGFNF